MEFPKIEELRAWVEQGGRLVTGTFGDDVLKCACALSAAAWVRMGKNPKDFARGAAQTYWDDSDDTNRGFEISAYTAGFDGIRYNAERAPEAYVEGLLIRSKCLQEGLLRPEDA